MLSPLKSGELKNSDISIPNPCAIALMFWMFVPLFRILRISAMVVWASPLNCARRYCVIFFSSSNSSIRVATASDSVTYTNLLCPLAVVGISINHSLQTIRSVSVVQWIRSVLLTIAFRLDYLLKIGCLPPLPKSKLVCCRLYQSLRQAFGIEFDCLGDTVHIRTIPHQL